MSEGLHRIPARVVEIKPEGTGRYRLNVIAHTERGKIYGLLSDNDIDGLPLGVTAGPLEIEIYETKYGNMILNRVTKRGYVKQ